MILKAYKYRIYPTEEQKLLIGKHFEGVTWVFNYALNKKIVSLQKEGKSLSLFTVKKDLPKLKKALSTSWLTQINSQSLQASLENLDKAFTGFFRDKKGFPKFKKNYYNKQSFSVPQYGIVNFVNNTISLPKFKKPIKCIIHRKFEGQSKTITISKTSTNKYYASVLVETPQDIKKLKNINKNEAVGLDLGIKTFAVLSNGEEIVNPRFFKKSLIKLKKIQKNIHKKVKGSNNYAKEIKKLCILHEKIRNQRHNFLHQVTSDLVSSYDTICLETLDVSDMIKNVQLRGALKDVSIGKFNSLLEYKAKWEGTNLLRIGQFEPSSKMCSCGVINKTLKLSQRVWTCTACNTTHSRDQLAANNIKNFAFMNLKNTVGTTEINACGDKN